MDQHLRYTTKIKTVGFIPMVTNIHWSTLMVGAHHINNKWHVMSIMMRIITGLLGGRLGEITWSIIIIIMWSYSPDDVELGSYRGPVRNNDIVEFIHVGTQKLLNR